MVQQGGLLQSLFGGNPMQQARQQQVAVQQARQQQVAVQQARRPQQQVAVQQARQQQVAVQQARQQQARQQQQQVAVQQARQQQQVAVQQARQQQQVAVQQARQQQQAAVQQQGGVRGDGYSSAHFLGSVATARGVDLAAKSADWRQRVSAEVNRLGPTASGKQQYKQALINLGTGKVKTEYNSRLTGFNPANVVCTKPMKGFAAGDCPAKRRKPIAPGTTLPIRSHRALSQAAASRVLRNYYRERANSYVNNIKGANRALAQDMSRKKGVHSNSPGRTHGPLAVCPTKVINYTHSKGKLAGRPMTRTVIDPKGVGFAACKRNWLYRKAGVSAYDMQGTDYGNKRVTRIRRSKNTSTAL